VIQGFGRGGPIGHPIALGQYPVMQRCHYRCCLFLAYSSAILIVHVPRSAFNFVQAANRVQCLFGHLYDALTPCHDDLT
jgi:hypothetical protein